MFEEHDSFNVPKGNIRLWRYMDLSKFLYLLSGELFFTRMDKFEDNFESTYPTFNKKIRELRYTPMLKDNILLRNLNSDFELASQNLKRTSYACCWHMNNFESAAMWKLYLSSNEGIAIQTNINKLISSLRSEDKRIYIGEVNYIDYENQYLPEDNLLNLLLYKRKSFDYERELRCIYTDFLEKKDDVPGKDIKIDLNELIEKVYIAPYAPKYFKTVIEDVIYKYGYDFEVIQSDMYNDLH